MRKKIKESYSKFRNWWICIDFCKMTFHCFMRKIIPCIFSYVILFYFRKFRISCVSNNLALDSKFLLKQYRVRSDRIFWNWIVFIYCVRNTLDFVYPSDSSFRFSHRGEPRSGLVYGHVCVYSWHVSDIGRLCVPKHTFASSLPLILSRSLSLCPSLFSD